MSVTAQAIPLRRCTGCQRDLPTTLFYGGEGTGLSSQCRVCRQAYSRAYRETHPRAGETKPHYDRAYEAGRYKQRGSVRVADDLTEATMAAFFADTHSRAFLLALCCELGIVEE